MVELLEIIGRDDELRRVLDVVAGKPGSPSQLVLEGEPGIGKTTLLGAGVDEARERGITTLFARPAEQEQGLDHAVLMDLLEPVLDKVLGRLLPPRRHALEIAMLRQHDAGARLDPRALNVAFLDVLQQLTERGALLVAVDDVQWVDSASGRVLGFALRRTRGGSVRVLMSRRTPSPAPAWAELPAGERLTIGPLSVGSVHHVLRDRLGHSLPRPMLLQLHELSGGNPFHALESAQAHERRGGDPLAPPRPLTLDQLLRQRLRDLPAPTRAALGVVAALGTATGARLARAGVSPETLAPAFEAKVLELDGADLRFTHPLLAAATYDELGPRRADVHRRLADLVDDPAQQGRHLALATEEPDGRTALIVEEAAGVASARGARGLAAELAEHAMRLTPAADTRERCRRTLAAARARQEAGDWTHARRLATEVAEGGGAGDFRTEALVLLSELAPSDEGAKLLARALEGTEGRPALASAIHCRLAWSTRFRSEMDHAATALALARQVDDPLLTSRAMVVKALLDWFRGAPGADEAVAELVDHLPDAVGGDRLVQEATQAVVNTLAPAPTRAVIREFLERERAMWHERDEPRSAQARWGLAWLDFWAGDWTAAAEHAAAAESVATQYGLEVPQDHLPLAVVAVHRGSLDLAELHSRRALDLADVQFGFHPPQHIAVLALVALGRGDRDVAGERFRLADERARELRWHESSMRWWTPDHVELLLELGALEPAEELLAEWEDDARRVSRLWCLAHATRCRAQLHAARGDVEVAMTTAAVAADEHRRLGDPFGAARAQLVLGTIERRRLLKSQARRHLEEAAAAFDGVGAERWAVKARAEAAQIGGRRREDGLTDAERRVVALVVQGRTNREVASALFLGERTVASHLTHIYAKLGVRSRTELARAVEGKPQTF